MSPEEEARIVEKAARAILARDDHDEFGESFDGVPALDILEEATGGFDDRTHRLARLALARARELEGKPPKHDGPAEPKDIGAQGGIPLYAARVEGGFGPAS